MDITNKTDKTTLQKIKKPVILGSIAIIIAGFGLLAYIKAVDPISQSKKAYIQRTIEGFKYYGSPVVALKQLPHDLKQNYRLKDDIAFEELLKQYHSLKAKGESDPRINEGIIDHYFDWLNLALKKKSDRPIICNGSLKQDIYEIGEGLSCSLTKDFLNSKQEQIEITISNFENYWKNNFLINFQNPIDRKRWKTNYLNIFKGIIINSKSNNTEKYIQNLENLLSPY